MRTQFRRWEAWIIAISPAVILATFVVLLAVPQTRRLAEYLLSENKPVEMLTFLSLAWAAVYGLIVVRETAVHREPKFIVAFYALFAFFAFVVAMEEISWGQQFFKFSTPEALKGLNAQGELTLHNLNGHNSSSDLVVFGVAGLFGYVLSVFPVFRKITPPLVMLPWFLLIALAAATDWLTDQSDIEQVHVYVIAWIGEVTEMMIGLACAIFLWLKRRTLHEAWRAAIAGA